jgi:hypothetical protein
MKKAVFQTEWTKRLDELNEHQARLVSLLDMMRTMRSGWRSEFYYLGKEDFLLQHGQWFSKCPWPHLGLEGAAKQCFVNSLDLTLSHGFAYVEGEALKADLPISFHHAWNLDAEGRLADSTWKNDGDAYLGVIFPEKTVVKALRRTGAVLDDYLSHWELFKKPWEG